MITEAMRLLFELANLKAESTCAVALAAVLSEPQLFEDRSACRVVSGGNVCTSFYRTILDAS
jgi:threo-3-hydroxy-L-aspartate ammonia-lyase